MGLFNMFRARPEETPAPVTETRETAEERESQCKLILDVLREGVSLTQSDAIYLFNCYRLSARIWDLRHRQKWGAPVIKDEMESDPRTGSRFKRYWMEP